MYGKLDRYPIDMEIESSMIGYWGKIVTRKGNKYVHIIYQALHKQDTNNNYQSPWVREIHNILTVCGLGNLFHAVSPNFTVNWLRQVLTEACMISSLTTGRRKFVRKKHVFCVDHLKRNLYLKST